MSQAGAVPELAEPADLPGLVDTFATAFADDAMIRWPMPDATPAMLQELFRVILTPYLEFGILWKIGGCDAGAAWLPPPVADRFDEIEQSARAAINPLTGDGGARYAAFWDWLGAHLPAERCWFLDAVAVAPAAQGRGLGRTLVMHGLERARADGCPAFLETGTPRNVPFYQSLGFRIVGEQRAPDGGPTIWFMQAPRLPRRRCRDQGQPATRGRRHRSVTHQVFPRGDSAVRIVTAAFGTTSGEAAMTTDTAAMNANPSVRPFHVDIADEAIVDLRRRIAAWRPPEREPVDDQSQGVQLATVRDLANYWATEYDWRRCEAKLNALEQFVTNIDGLDVHFIHVRSPLQNALPLIVSHGWPGSIIEQLKVIEPLTNPTEHAGSASDAFDVVIPSLPGYGFSGKPAASGWGPDRIARAWAVLMERLGYTRYVAQGGDWGTAISAAMARQAPEGLLGIHVNFAQMVPLDVLGHIRNGDPAPAGLSDAEKRAYEQVAFATYHRGYGVIQGIRPQTIGYSLADTPVGLAAWLLDHDAGTYEHLARLFAGHPFGAITRDDWLDNTSLYWFTNTAASAARLYWQQAITGQNFNAPANVSLPAAVTVFPEEYVHAPRSWTEKAYHNLIYFNQAERGGHFAAWEQPQLFSEELRAAFRTLR